MEVQSGQNGQCISPRYQCIIRSCQTLGFEQQACVQSATWQHCKCMAQFSVHVDESHYSTSTASLSSQSRCEWTFVKNKLLSNEIVYHLSWDQALDDPSTQHFPIHESCTRAGIAADFTRLTSLCLPSRLILSNSAITTCLGPSITCRIYTMQAQLESACRNCHLSFLDLI